MTNILNFKSILLFSVFTFSATISSSQSIFQKKEQIDSVNFIRDSLFLSKNGGSSQVIQGDDLPVVPTFSLDQALIGKVVGAFITSPSGTPGSSANIQLRSVNTLGYSYNSPDDLTDPGTLPLILVDGVQVRQTRLSSLDPGIIDRVEIITGPATSAIYGYQGANGVIQIFTKKGSRGKISIDASTYISVNTAISNSGVNKTPFHSFPTDASGNLLDTNGKILTLDPSTLTFSGQLNQNLRDPNNQLTKLYQGTFHYVDHFDQFYKKATGTTNTVSLSGGGKKTDVLFALSNNKIENTFANDGYNSRTNLALNVGLSLTKKLTLRSITQFILTENTVNYFENDAIVGLLNTRPFVDYSLKDDQGNYGLTYGQAARGSGYNPNYYFQYSHRKHNTEDFVQSFSASYKINNWLSAEGRYGFNAFQNRDRIIVDDQSANKNHQASNQIISATNRYNVNGERIDRDATYSITQGSLQLTAALDFKKELRLSLPIKSTSKFLAEWKNFSINGSENAPQAYFNSYRNEFAIRSFLATQAFSYNNWFEVAGAYRKDFSSNDWLNIDGFGKPQWRQLYRNLLFGNHLIY
jgi:hypothetical protein